MHRAYIGLGSNIGDRVATFRRALEMLDAMPDVAVVRVSRFIDTAPISDKDREKICHINAERVFSL